MKVFQKWIVLISNTMYIDLRIDTLHNADEVMIIIHIHICIIVSRCVIIIYIPFMNKFIQIWFHINCAIKTKDVLQYASYICIFKHNVSYLNTLIYIWHKQNNHCTYVPHYK